MKKKLLMAAVSSALVAGPILSAHAAGPTVYGRLNLGLASVNNGNDTDKDTFGVTDDASRLGVKGDEDLGGGLKAIYTMELAYDGDGNGGVTGAARDVFAGLQGSWGTFRLGHFNSAYKNLSTGLEIFGDTIGDFTHSTFQGETRINNAISYGTPNFNGFSGSVESSRGETGTSGEANPTILAASYSAGPLYVGVGRVDNDLPQGSAATAIEDSLKIAARFNINAFSIWGVNEDADAVDSGNDLKTLHLGASYKMGNTTFALTNTNYEVKGGDNDADQLAVGAVHALSKNTAVKFVYTKIDNETSATRSGRLITNAGIGLTTTAPAAGKDPDGWQVQLSVSF